MAVRGGDGPRLLPGRRTSRRRQDSRAARPGLRPEAAQTLRADRWPATADTAGSQPRRLGRSPGGGAGRAPPGEQLEPPGLPASPACEDARTPSSRRRAAPGSQDACGESSSAGSSPVQCPLPERGGAASPAGPGQASAEGSPVPLPCGCRASPGGGTHDSGRDSPHLPLAAISLLCETTASGGEADSPASREPALVSKAQNQTD
ncbi:collagen, type I, alpha 1b-like isoform X3 [Equus caballus]|uniref:collagen, type I, alpha 1b-like isoform X3 n=1 Tax=Equus caballus TaxID=9796 RepID=UPI0038B398A0